MSKGRMHIEGTFHLITNRCFQGRFFLRPSEEINSQLALILARSMQKFGDGIEILAFIFLSNHFHILLRNNGGNIAKLIGCFESSVARNINALTGWKGKFWGDRYDDVIIEGDEALQKKFTYVLSNAVRAGLVDEAHMWPGFSSLSHNLSGEPYSYTVFNRARYNQASRGRKNKPPKQNFVETYRWSLATLPTMAQCRFSERAEHIRKAVEQADAFHRGMREDKPSLGIKMIMSQNPLDRPAASDPKIQRKRKRFDCADPVRLEELEENYRLFIARYKEVYEQYWKTTPANRSFHNDWPLGSYPPSGRNVVFSPTG